MVLALCVPAMGAMADAEKVITVQTGEPECMDPTMNDYSNGSFVMCNLFTGLYTYDADGQMIPGMAESYTVNDDATVFTFTMNPDAKWSDGSKLTAYDFEYAFLRTLNPENAAEGAYCLYDIKNAQAYFTGQCDVSEVGVKALDEGTLVLETSVPTPWFMELVAGSTSYYPVKKDAVEAFPGLQEWTKSPDTYVCNGPFMPAELNVKSNYKVVKNPYYIGADHVKVDAINYVFIDTAEASLVAFENGEIDVLMNLSTDALAQYRETDQFFTSPKQGLRYYHFNCNKAPFDDARVRKAFRLALLTAVAAGLGFFGLTALFSRWIVAMFIDSSCPACAIAVRGLPLFASGFVFFAVNIVSIGYFQSVERPRPAMAVTVLRGFVFMAACFFGLPLLLGVEGIWLAVPLAEALTFAVVAAIYGRTRLKSAF